MLPVSVAVNGVPVSTNVSLAMVPIWAPEMPWWFDEEKLKGSSHGAPLKWLASTALTTSARVGLRPALSMVCTNAHAEVIPYSRLPSIGSFGAYWSRIRVHSCTHGLDVSVITGS